MENNYELNQMAWKRNVATWGEPPEKVTGSERELMGDALVLSAFREGMKELDKLTNKGIQVNMREYGKLMAWCSNELHKSFEREIEKSRKDGWKIQAHHWPGEDGSLRSNLDLHPTEFDISFMKKFNEGKIDWDGDPIEYKVAEK